jgi:hypothetical protein
MNVNDVKLRAAAQKQGRGGTCAARAHAQDGYVCVAVARFLLLLLLRRLLLLPSLLLLLLLLLWRGGIYSGAARARAAGAAARARHRRRGRHGAPRATGGAAPRSGGPGASLLRAAVDCRPAGAKPFGGPRWPGREKRSAAAAGRW